MQRWQNAEAGIGDYQAIFVPWFWDEGYVRDATGFVPTDEEMEYRETHGLTNEQLAWRRNKIAELGDETCSCRNIRRARPRRSR
jgi:hypothetical protein